MYLKIKSVCERAVTWTYESSSPRVMGSYLRAAEKFDRTLRSHGTFKYFCVVHTEATMQVEF